jgi:diacylglycerol kinase (ATP)
MKKQRLSDAFKYAWAGIKNTAISERNFKIHLALAALAVAACVVLRVDGAKIMAVVFAIFFVLGAELVNTAVEAVTDLASGGQKHPLAKIAKDAAAGAVLLAAVNAVIIAGFVAYDVLFK